MRTRTTLVAAALLYAATLSACKLEHPATPTAIADSSAIARALSLASVPQLDATGSSTLSVSAARIGGTFASAFEREMAPMVAFANRRSATGRRAVYRVEVERLSMAEDSALALVAVSNPAGTSHVRMMLLPRAEGGWRVVSKRVMSTVAAESAGDAVPAASLSSVRPPD